MPRIPQGNADQIANGEVERTGKRRAFEGYALVKLIEAEEAAEKESGYAGQDLTFEVVEPREVKGYKVWEYISYNPNTNWKWQDFFDAFSFEPDSDTDEIVEAGEDPKDPAYAIIETTIEIQSRGKNKGRGKTRVVGYLNPAEGENRDLVGVTLEPSEDE